MAKKSKGRAKKRRPSTKRKPRKKSATLGVGAATGAATGNAAGAGTAEGRARGQSSRMRTHQEYPHQVLVSTERVVGKALDKVIAFHAELGIPTKTRSIRKDDRWYSLYCFADSQHAARFQVEVGGEIINQRKEPQV